MSVSNSRLAYLDCYEIMDRALERSVGCRVRQPSEDAATYLRMRIHQARTIDRRDNAKTYDREHPLHSRSHYDILRITIREENGAVFLYAQKNESKAALIEDLGEPARALTAPAPIQIEPPRLAIEDHRHDDLADEPAPTNRGLRRI